MNVQAILDDIGAHWHVYLTMPFIAALIGYLTKRVAIEMMFKPLEFVGIKPFLGWQGVIPANARRMSTTAVDLLTKNLVDPREIFSRLDPQRMVEELEEPLLKAVEDVTREVMEQHQPRLWELLPARAQQMLVNQVRAQAPKVVERLMREISTNIDEVLDVNSMLIEAMVRDKALTCRLIRDVAAPEFKFIARSGIYFGFVIGLVQFVAWALTKQPIIMPIFGFVTGFVTDWLALKMIFYPREPRGFGFFRWQGMFQKRRRQVAADYGALIAEEVLTVRNVMEAVLTGPKSDRLFAMIQREVQRTIDQQASIAKPIVALTVGGKEYQQMKRAAAAKAIEYLPETVKHVEGYATGALDVRNTIVTKMQQLTPIEFEGILRPAFKQDEWKLIAVGAIIGGLVGELQVLLLLH
ncbi:Uncharacterized membrane protein YheB, UPF0754 family [Amycolatopsis xylanica]|uniref:Uncharacterized membrane protein YheB, UPF0754 family n=1 Tax=Amycolatopsis xylanica TaxID=589385 RepID=A0A1H2Z103_9PSEU|nr:DUF445 family protein [Amycolatopsis xylanica]SDX10479.1 Uncharacterized membrane protein YheB, UPF0754 family [Amycolatopsis xylanica]